MSFVSIVQCLSVAFAGPVCWMRQGRRLTAHFGSVDAAVDWMENMFYVCLVGYRGSRELSEDVLTRLELENASLPCALRSRY